MKSNLPVNVASALCYLPYVGGIASIVFLIVESEKKVRFHAVRSLVLDLVAMCLFFVTAITIVLPPLVAIAYIVMALVLAIKAYSNEDINLQFIDVWTNKIIEKVTVGSKK